jgi:hypothetical protein
MRRINDGDGIRELNITDLVEEFQIDVTFLDKGDIDETEYQLAIAQYAYIKFGLVLQKVRNQCMWKRCTQKFLDFRDFCQHKVNLNIWQVTNAIKSAQVAVRLASLGFTELPRNASQALKLSELAIERLGEVWGNVVASCQGHKITAHAIEQQINPDKQPTSDTIRLPNLLADKIRREAIERGISVTEYIEGLMSGQFAADNTIEPVEMSIDAEVADIVNNLDRPARPAMTKKFLEQSLDRFDDLMDDLIGRFIPPVVRRVANE